MVCLSRHDAICLEFDLSPELRWSFSVPFNSQAIGVPHFPELCWCRKQHARALRVPPCPDHDARTYACASAENRTRYASTLRWRWWVRSTLRPQRGALGFLPLNSS